MVGASSLRYMGRSLGAISHCSMLRVSLLIACKLHLTFRIVYRVLFEQLSVLQLYELALVPVVPGYFLCWVVHGVSLEGNAVNLRLLVRMYLFFYSRA